MENRRRKLLCAAITSALLAIGTTVTTSAQAVDAEVPAGLIDEVTQQTSPIYKLSEAVQITVNIPIGGDNGTVDTDKDGKPDRVQLRILRPNTAAGEKVPTIIEPTPYTKKYEETLAKHAFDLKEDATPREPVEPGAIPNENLQVTSSGASGDAKAKWDMTWESWFDNYFVPRGYAVADLDALGTGYSEGCAQLGSSNEQAGVKAAVDWLNGRTVGYDDDGGVLTADSWSSGKVGMKGKSANGALAIEAAASGVEGLETIVPIAGMADWYDYTRTNGAVINPAGSGGYDLDNFATERNNGKNQSLCEDSVKSDFTDKLARHTGDRTQFWMDRNYNVPPPRASVFLIHGVNDSTVRPSASTHYWDTIQAAGVPSKLWISQTGHFRPFQYRPEEYVRQMHAWYDHWLYDIENGIMGEDKVDVQNSNDLTWSSRGSWPAADSANVTLHLHSNGSLDTSEDRLAAKRQRITDVGATRTPESVLDQSGRSNGNSLAYVTEELASDVTLEGTPSFSLVASLNGPSPYLTALLVDYGDQATNQSYLSTEPEFTSASLYDSGTGCKAGSITLPEDYSMDRLESNSGCALPDKTSPGKPGTNFRVIGRGWLDVRNRASDTSQEEVRDGTTLTFSFNGEPINYTVKSGHKLGIVIVSTDHKYTLHYLGTSGTAQTSLAVNTELSRITLPVKSGSSALD